MEELVSLYESVFGSAPEEIQPITGSASNRKYFRMGSHAGKCVGVVGLDPLENKAFISLSGHFRSKGICVPEVLAVSEDGLSYIQENLGEVMLADLVDKARKGEAMGCEDQIADILCRTMSELPKLQFDGAQGLDFSVCYPLPSFDRRSVMFDLNYFKYCFLKPSGLEFNEVFLQDDFEKLADDLLKDDMDTFMYRDFNARNVMLKDGVPYFIDFQGGRRGPIYYDVASFVWQARAAYPSALKERLVDSYIDALSAYVCVDRDEFYSRLRLFTVFRLLQVLGAYGFRGWVEGKAPFVVSIPAAVASLAELLPFIHGEYPYLTDTLQKMTALPRFAPSVADGKLEVRVYSFSFKKGIPQDTSGNGGGYVFDCRSIHNPGRYELYKKLTGRDPEVIRFLEDDGEIMTFLDHVYGVVVPHVDTYRRRGFTSLMVSFGCTGGQHRSVYCAEHLAHHLASLYPDIRIRLIHREQSIEKQLKS